MNNYPLDICVCGAGTMGSGIAQVFAQYGFNITLFDLDNEVLAIAKQKIEQRLTGRSISYTSKPEDCVGGLIIEAVVENEEVKASLFNQLAVINNENAIFATNTSSLSVSAIATKISRPAQLIGMHFFNPAPVMKLVEIVTTPQVTHKIIETVAALARDIGKTPVICKDAPGFIVNHVARPFYLEALYLVQRGVTDFQTVDTLMETSGFKMGPFRLMDLIGNDVNYSVSRIVYEALGKPSRLEPSPIQKEKVDKGMLGRKTGKGYYEYPTN